MNPQSDFRRWVDMLWQENCRERCAWREPESTLVAYWDRYKWWLRREYRHQNKIDKKIP